MPSIELFSRFELTKEEVFNYLLKSQNISRYLSPFFTLETIQSKNSKIDLETSYIQKSVFLDSLQILYKIKEIVPDNKISYSLEGLIKGTQNIQLVSIENSCILRDKIDVSLYNQFNLLPINILISIFFYLDTCIKHLRLKSIIYKDLGISKEIASNEFSKIRSYIVIDADFNGVNSLFEDFNKLTLWVSPYLKLKKQNENNFLISFSMPLLPTFSCKINHSNPNKVEISFSNTLIKGKNIWSILPCENELIIENTIELEQITFYLNILWLILGNTLLRNELRHWNKRLKEVAEKTNLSRHLETCLNQA